MLYSKKKLNIFPCFVKFKLNVLGIDMVGILSKGVLLEDSEGPFAWHF